VIRKKLEPWHRRVSAASQSRCEARCRVKSSDSPLQDASNSEGEMWGKLDSALMADAGCSGDWQALRPEEWPSNSLSFTEYAVLTNSANMVEILSPGECFQRAR
jgi:hypothetical protein